MAVDSRAYAVQVTALGLAYGTDYEYAGSQAYQLLGADGCVYVVIDAHGNRTEYESNWKAALAFVRLHEP